MAKKRVQTKKQMRNLAQYKHMTDEEFNDFWEANVAEDLEEDVNLDDIDFGDRAERYAKKLEEFSNDYDIDDLKINDKEALIALINAIIALEDHELIIHEKRTKS